MTIKQLYPINKVQTYDTYDHIRLDLTKGSNAP